MGAPRLVATNGAPGHRRCSPAELDSAAERIQRDGICVLRNLLSPSIVKRWARAFNQVLQERTARPGTVAARGEGRFYVTLPWRPPFSDARVFAHPDILGLLGRVFGQPYLMVQLAADTPVRGSQYQEIHRDHRPLFGDDVVTPLYALAVNVPLCDVSMENGPLEVARGTHRLSRAAGLAAIASGESVLEPVPMRVGDVAIRTPLALHRGTPNRTDSPRPMAVMGYVMRWLHTPNVGLRIPRAAHDALAERLRALLRCEIVDTLPEASVETYAEFQY